MVNEILSFSDKTFSLRNSDIDKYMEAAIDRLEYVKEFKARFAPLVSKLSNLVNEEVDSHKIDQMIARGEITRVILDHWHRTFFSPGRKSGYKTAPVNSEA